MTRRSLPPPTPAFVLHQHDWSETSLIVELFTRGQGRVAVAAKGAKRPHSQLRPVLMPFQRLSVSLGAVKDEGAEIHTLRAAEWAGGGPVLPAAALFSGFYLNELLLRLLPRADAQPLLFDAYAGSLPALASGEDTLMQAALRAFELLLLRELGLLPTLDLLTAQQTPLLPSSVYSLRPELGLVAAAMADNGLTGRQWSDIQQALDDGELVALQLACAQALPALKTTSRGLLHYHLGSARLRTREVMIDAQQWMERG
ncbi:DNA repair protein RecO [Ideonella livida]|uniref:DNA repair protein RecO n=1 Tax=Ideonella livida TaxID=2707176 RepID=A0A7C9TIW6_9BURK|nr:DNA repair protein RecO [Ideonella livida]NDY91601.1 DNA repair protein RecO [Ideonella livida]